MRIQVKDFMTSPVLTAVSNEKVGDVRGKMERNKIHAMPVVELERKLPGNEILIRGIVTMTDLVKVLDENLKVEEIMTSSSVHVLHKDSSAQSAARMMLKHKVHHLVVMDDGEIVGMVSSLDFAKLVAEHSLA